MYVHQRLQLPSVSRLVKADDEAHDIAIAYDSLHCKLALIFSLDGEIDDKVQREEVKEILK